MIIDRGGLRSQPRAAARMRHAAGFALVLLAAAGCTAATNELNPGREEVTVAAKASLGSIVVDDEGRTMYMFEKDESDESYCTGACASVWPPVTTKGAPKVEGGLDASKVSTIRRDDGLMQVVYAGHPLYYYQGDTDRQDTNGQEQDQFGAEWYALTPQGGQDESHNTGGDTDGY